MRWIVFWILVGMLLDQCSAPPAPIPAPAPTVTPRYNFPTPTREGTQRGPTITPVPIITFTPTQIPGTVMYVATAQLNVRQSPSASDFPAMGQLRQGTMIRVVLIGDWAKVTEINGSRFAEFGYRKYDGSAAEVGWVWAAYLVLDRQTKIDYNVDVG